MTPEAEDYLAKAREDLAEARKILGIGLGKAAARGACYVAFHAAEGLLVERTGRIAKTHSGLRTAFAQLLRQGPREDRELLTFLTRGYKYKELSDYAVGRMAVVTETEAAEMVEGAARFLARVTAMLSTGGSGRAAPDRS